MARFIKLSIFTVLCLSAVSFSGCESKFNEPAPQGVQFANIKLQRRLSANSTLDAKLNSLEQSAQKLKNIISLFRRAQHNDDTTYTPIDLILDVSEQLKQGLPDGTSKHYFKEASVRLPLSNLSPECQTINAIFKTEPMESDPVTGVPTQKAVLQLQSCYSNDFVTALEMDAEGTRVSFNLNANALNKIFYRLLPDELNRLASSCSFNQDTQGIITNVECDQMIIPLSETEMALTRLEYNISGDPRLDMFGTIFGSQAIIKGTVHIRIAANGNVLFKIKKAHLQSVQSSAKTTAKAKMTEHGQNKTMTTGRAATPTQVPDDQTIRI